MFIPGFDLNLFFQNPTECLSQVEGVSKKRINKGILYTLDRDVTKKYLEDAKEYNEDAFLHRDSGTWTEGFLKKCLSYKGSSE